jgi:hypothetical protein
VFGRLFALLRVTRRVLFVSKMLLTITEYSIVRTISCCWQQSKRARFR